MKVSAAASSSAIAHARGVALAGAAVSAGMRPMICWRHL
jgi:hypothetical protein